MNTPVVLITNFELTSIVLPDNKSFTTAPVIFPESFLIRETNSTLLQTQAPSISAVLASSTLSLASLNCAS